MLALTEICTVYVTPEYSWCSIPIGASVARNRSLRRMNVVMLLPNVLGKGAGMTKRLVAITARLLALGFHSSRGVKGGLQTAQQ